MWGLGLGDFPGGVGIHHHEGRTEAVLPLPREEKREPEEHLPSQGWSQEGLMW